MFAEAGRLAYADRNQYMADADFVNVPSSALLDRSYLKNRNGLIERGRSMGKAAPSNPGRSQPLNGSSTGSYEGY
jgi:gamma-glutamyltranspeptidase/glutathione hydrolase